MRSLPSRSWLAALLAVPLALASAPAHAQEAPPSPVPEAPPAPAYPPPPVQAYPPPPVPAYQAPPAPTYEPRSSSGWYGWQSLIAVAPFDIAMFVGLARFDDRAGPAAFTAGFIGRNVAPAVVHLAHGRPSTAFGSIGLHAAATGTGIAVGYAIGIALENACPPVSTCRNGFRTIPVGPGYGAVAGSMVGTVLDVVFLAHRTRLPWNAAQLGPTWSIAPYAAPTALGFAAGGTF